MSTFYPAVMAQVDFACSVLGFIKRLLRAVLPGLARDKGVLGTKEQFAEQLDAAFAKIDPHDATEADYRFAVANAACEELSDLCGILSDACECVRLGDVARRYLSSRRFIRLVLQQDAAKLAALTAVVKSGDRNAGRMLMRVGAVLDGRPDNYDGMAVAAKRKATEDARKIIAEVQSLAKKIDDGKDEIVGHVDAVGVKLDGLRVRGVRKGKYSDSMREMCRSYWNAAQNNAEIRYSINTRITHESVFRYFERQLSEHGITSATQFRQILHSAQNLECARRKKKLEARQDKARQKSAAKTKSSAAP